MNDYIWQMLQGQQPSNAAFLNPGMPPTMTPPFNPASQLPSRPDQAAGLSGLDKLIRSPSGAFILNLLAQSGRSLTPGPGPAAAIGRAALASSAQREALQMNEVQRQLLEATIGLRQRQASPQAQLRTQSTRTLANGNIGIVTNDPTNPVIDTGVKEAGKSQVINVPGLGLIRHDPVSQEITEVAPEEIIRKGQAARKGAESEASTAATESTKQQFNLPQRIQAADDQIRQIDSTLEEAQRALGLTGVTSTGVIGNLLKEIPGTDAFALNRALQPIKAALSFDRLSQMRAASPTGGALGQVSERELSLLQDSLVSLDQAQGPGDVKRALTKVLTHYSNWKAIMERQKENMQNQQADDVSGFSIVDPNANE